MPTGGQWNDLQKDFLRSLRSCPQEGLAIEVPGNTPLERIVEPQSVFSFLFQDLASSLHTHSCHCDSLSSSLRVFTIASTLPFCLQNCELSKPLLFYKVSLSRIFSYSSKRQYSNTSKSIYPKHTKQCLYNQIYLHIKYRCQYSAYCYSF